MIGLIGLSVMSACGLILNHLTSQLRVAELSFDLYLAAQLQQQLSDFETASSAAVYLILSMMVLRLCLKMSVRVKSCCVSKGHTEKMRRCRDRVFPCCAVCCSRNCVKLGAWADRMTMSMEEKKVREMTHACI